MSASVSDREDLGSKANEGAQDTIAKAAVTVDSSIDPGDDLSSDGDLNHDPHDDGVWDYPNKLTKTGDVWPRVDEGITARGLPKSPAAATADVDVGGLQAELLNMRRRINKLEYLLRLDREGSRRVFPSHSPQQHPVSPSSIGEPHEPVEVQIPLSPASPRGTTPISDQAPAASITSTAAGGQRQRSPRPYDTEPYVDTEASRPHQTPYKPPLSRSATYKYPPSNAYNQASYYLGHGQSPYNAQPYGYNEPQRPHYVPHRHFDEYSSDEDIDISYGRRRTDKESMPHHAEFRSNRANLLDLLAKRKRLETERENELYGNSTRIKAEEVDDATVTSPQRLRELRTIRRANEAKRRNDVIEAEESRKDTQRDIEKAQNLQTFFLDAHAAQRREVDERIEVPENDASALVEQGPRLMAPSLRRTSWKEFQSAETLFSLRPLPVIDILRSGPSESGMPSSTLKQNEEAQADPSKADTSAGFGKLKTRPSFPSEVFPGQEPLPERIRVRDPIVRVLDRLSDWKHNKPHPRILLRPYRRLVDQRHTLRWYWKYWAAYYLHDGQMHKASELGPATESLIIHVPLGSAAEVNHVECLVKFIEDYIEPKLKWVANPECDKISFPDLWYLFNPGDFVIGHGGRQVYRVLSIASTGHRASTPFRDYTNLSSSTSERLDMPFRILCSYIDFNGQVLRPVLLEFTIKKYEGEKAISSLDVQPARFDTDPGHRERFIKRGKRFLKAAGIQHAHYAGLTIGTMDEVDSQVVIDLAECINSLGWTAKHEAGSAVGVGATIPAFETCQEYCCQDDYIDHDESVELERDEAFMSSLLPPKWTASKLPSVTVYPRSLAEANTDENRITDEEYLIMSYQVYGFILNTRKWAQLDLDFVKPVGSRRDDDDDDSVHSGAQYDRDMGVSFDQLVLPKGHKEMVLSLVAQHYRNKDMAFVNRAQYDIVRGKGKGLILLLHGAPGVGKTSTAECVAERFEKPLFQITCGDLGTTAYEVEQALEKNFSLANKWGCILLLDEADVFLARRTSNDFARNGLVAVFLRILEYYAGILFLTTNRVGDFDEAFTSRIHISLNYPALDEDSTDAIFEVNLQRIKNRFDAKKRKLDLDEVKIRMFARTYWRENPKARWNGRQIRNACQTALALSEFEAQGGMAVFENAEGKYDTKQKDSGALVKLGVQDFKTVAAAYLSFIEYLDDIYGADSETRAKEHFLRAIYKDVASGGGAGVPNLNPSAWASNGSGWRHLGEGAPAMSSQGQYQGQQSAQSMPQQQQQQQYYPQMQQAPVQQQQQLSPNQQQQYQSQYQQHAPNQHQPSPGVSVPASLPGGPGIYHQPAGGQPSGAPLSYAQQFQGQQFQCVGTPPPLSSSTTPSAQNIPYPGQLGGSPQPGPA